MLSSWISFKLVQLIQMRLFRMRKMQLIHSELLPLPVQNALSDADKIMQTTRSSAGEFSSSLSQALSDGELLLGKANSSASAGITDLATAAGRINTSVSTALGYANQVNELNADILADMQDLAGPASWNNW